MVKEYQATEKARRTKKHNETIPGRERRMRSETGQTVTLNEGRLRPEQCLTNRTLMQRLYMEQVKPGLTKTLAHRWHGPFRVKKNVEEFVYKLELPDRNGYRFYLVVHVSRLKAVDEFGDRPSARLTPDVNEAS
ncbi:hypothetical protein PHMEG_0005593 [Phytophthora megakarya]|uniref:Tf2-1-like SH3-like domain-containing protein n=1 Tax=Phytophthora megakarya TaxID=4795 RepID=A0A225WQZ7_9STRA|nr:hypothetical protein PHMEG_0005587 [Phytophthora megakarya]OWZ20047.1 hypothetical protein PHMEG_0005593 [Phytophthora megakarya]